MRVSDTKHWLATAQGNSCGVKSLSLSMYIYSIPIYYKEHRIKFFLTLAPSGPLGPGDPRSPLTPGSPGEPGDPGVPSAPASPCGDILLVSCCGKR